MTQQNGLIPDYVQKIIARRNVSVVPLAEALHLLWTLQQRDGSILKPLAITTLADLYAEHDIPLRGSPQKLAKDRYRHFVQYRYLMPVEGKSHYYMLSNKANVLLRRWLPQYDSKSLKDYQRETMIVRRRVIRKRLKVLENRIARDQNEVEELNKSLQGIENNLLNMSGS